MYYRLKEPVWNLTYFRMLEVQTLSPIEIYASKTVALMTRAAARDLYDLNYMIRYGLFDRSELELYRKCVVFYLAIATETPPVSLSYQAMDQITPHKITTDLKSVIRDRDAFELESAKDRVASFLSENLYLNDSEQEFLQQFRKGRYRPELLFHDPEILDRIQSHPMALWKVMKRSEREV